MVKVMVTMKMVMMVPVMIVTVIIFFMVMVITMMVMMVTKTLCRALNVWLGVGLDCLRGVAAVTRMIHSVS